MVGGAVLTPEYASQIQADFYARDAKESVDIAKRVTVTTAMGPGGAVKPSSRPFCAAYRRKKA